MHSGGRDRLPSSVSRISVSPRDLGGSSSLTRRRVRPQKQTACSHAHTEVYVLFSFAHNSLVSLQTPDTMKALKMRSSFTPTTFSWLDRGYQPATSINNLQLCLFGPPSSQLVCRKRMHARDHRKSLFLGGKMLKSVSSFPSSLIFNGSCFSFMAVSEHKDVALLSDSCFSPSKASGSLHKVVVG